MLLIFSILAILGSRKLIIDRFKLEVLNKIYGNELEKEEVEEDLTYKDNSGANRPELLNNMIPVYYDGSNWIYADIKEEWYDYDKKEWANAVVLNSGVTKNVGDTIAETDIALWYVWIPRYTYTIFNGNNGSVNPLEIQIKFESGISSSGTVKCVDAVSGSGTSSETCIDTTNGSIKNGTSTYTHPAFTFGDQELTGFWVGKFEVSGSTSQITIKPNITSLRNQTFSAFFIAIQNMSTTYSLNGDSHMIKNMEWGAVVYLSHSKYGTCTNGSCTEVAINSNSSYYTGGGATNAYKTNVGQSTTQNIYGVYDMSGGAWDAVMGTSVDQSGNFFNNNTGFSITVNSKYYDQYSYNKFNYLSKEAFIISKLGDSMKENIYSFTNTRYDSWYGGYSQFFEGVRIAWMLRGGTEGVSSSVFSFGSNDGSGEVTASSRAVLCK